MFTYTLVMIMIEHYLPKSNITWSLSLWAEHWWLQPGQHCGPSTGQQCRGLPPSKGCALSWQQEGVLAPLPHLLLVHSQPGTTQATRTVTLQAMNKWCTHQYRQKNKTNTEVRGVVNDLLVKFEHYWHDSVSILSKVSAQLLKNMYITLRKF